MVAGGLEGVFAAIKLFLESACPDQEVDTIVVHFTDKNRRPVEFPVQLPVSPANGHNRGPTRLTQMEQDILEAVGADTLTGEQIAQRAGYPYDSGLKQTLSSLRRQGFLSGERGDTGYSVLRGPES